MKSMEQKPEFDSVEQKEQAERNLLSNPMDTIRAMAEVEGPAWFATQDDVNRGVSSEGEYANSLSNALERLEAKRSSTVFGHGGLNRWFIKADGTVYFSESHAASLGHLRKAQELGFTIVP